MDNLIISKARMKDILGGMMESYLLSAPVRDGKVTDFRDITDANDILMDDQIPYKSPKEFFLPRCEKLFSFGEDGAAINLPDRPRVIFGVKPCDLEAIAILTKVLLEGKFADPFWGAHLENNLLIGVGCREQKPGCFCHRLGVDMAYSGKCDLFLEDLGEDYRILYLSDKGMKKLGEHIPGVKNFEGEATCRKIAPDLFLPEDCGSIFDKVNWEAISEICHACGLCTFICPTCHCFEFKDVQKYGQAKRFRNWDSCIFPKFTLHASGHNPRESKAARYRQRILHKYLYFVQNQEITGCTGCGRCIRSCPAGMNIERIVEGIMEELS